ncbi:MAG: hypothetical protein ACRD1T_05820 [Acidimicrobiia bacterium]
MSGETHFEEQCGHAFRELRDSASVELSEDHYGPVSQRLSDVDYAFQSLADNHDVHLGQEFRRYFFRYNEIGASWRITGTHSVAVGEFFLTHIYRCVAENFMEDSWEPRNGTEERIFPDLRIIDDPAWGGSGMVTAIRVAPGVSNPEIWFYDLQRGLFQLAMNYGEYLENLLTTKGIAGWQYLFADVQLGEPAFRPVASHLKGAFEMIPDVFPDHDYTPLQMRLEERL